MMRERSALWTGAVGNWKPRNVKRERPNQETARGGRQSREEPRSSAFTAIRAAFRRGAWTACAWNLSRPVSEMAAYRELIRHSFEKQPATTIAEACERIFQLTGLRRGPSQCASSSRIWA